MWTYERAFGGDAILAGIVDTGISDAQAELSGVVSGSSACLQGRPCRSTAAADDNGHGTAMAGLMRALHNTADGSPLGVASAGTLLSCKALDKQGVGYASDAAMCIQQLISQSASIILLSWGGDGSSEVAKDVIRRACERSVLLVVPAGNNNDDAATSFPASLASEAGFECLLVVASTTRDDVLAATSNHGDLVSIAAPGGP